MRPLRTIERSPSLKIVVEALIASLVPMAFITAIAIFVYLIFAVVGVHIWAGKFWYCNDDSVSYWYECTGDYMADGVSTARQWTNPEANFDDVGRAMLTLMVRPLGLGLGLRLL